MIAITFNKAQATQQQLAFLKKAYTANRTRSTVTVLGVKHLVTSVREVPTPLHDIDVRIELTELRVRAGVVRDVATNQPVNLRVLPCCSATYSFLVKQGWTDDQMVLKGWAEWV